MQSLESEKKEEEKSFLWKKKKAHRRKRFLSTSNALLLSSELRKPETFLETEMGKERFVLSLSSCSTPSSPTACLRLSARELERLSEK